MSIAYNVWNKHAGQAAQPSPARLGDYAFVHSLIDEHDKAQFAAMRACAQGRANVAQHKTLCAEHARLIPTFHVFRSLVPDDLRAAYDKARRFTNA